MGFFLMILLRHRFARAAGFFREIPILGKPVLHRKHGLLIVQMCGGFEGEVREYIRRHVGEVDRRVLRIEVSAAGLALLAEAERGLVVGADVVRALRDLD